MAVTFIKKPPTQPPEAAPIAQSIAQPEVPPWEALPTDPKPETLLEALAKFDGAQRLFIVHIESQVELEVKHWDAATSRAVLIGPHNMRLNPRITSREDGKYHPIWR